MTAPRQTVRLKNVQFSEALVDEAVRRAGGHRIEEEVSLIPEGVKNCDYRIDGYLMELKTNELEPLERPERQKKLVTLFEELAQEGKIDVESSRGVHLTGEASQRYWRIVGTPVRRDLEEASKQIRDTRILLKRPDLRGAVFLINSGGDSIDPTSFWNLASRHRRDFSAYINVVMCFSAIPAVVQGLNQPCLTFDYAHSGDGTDQEFVELFRPFFHSVIGEKLGKKPNEVGSDDSVVHPLRAPFEINTAKGKTVIF